MKFLFVVILILAMPLAAYSQNFIGVKAGMNYSKVNGIGSMNYTFDWINGYHVGVFFLRNIGEKLYLQPELVYNNRGYYYIKYYVEDRIVSGDTVQLKQNTKLNYLDVPLVARLQLGKVYFEAGPQFGVHLDGKSENVYELNKNGEVSYFTSSRDTRTIVEPVDIGYIVGLGYQADMGLGIGIRYNQGFREVVRRVNWEKNILLQASVSYILGYNAFIKGKANSAVPKVKQQDEYFVIGNAKEKSRGYRIISKQNVLRFNVVKTGEAIRSEVQYVFNSVGSRAPSSILISGSSGTEVQTSLFTGFRDIEVPFNGIVQYTAQSSIGEGSIESYLEIEIKEPGIWRITIMTQ